MHTILRRALSSASTGGGPKSFRRLDGNAAADAVIQAVQARFAPRRHGAPPPPLPSATQVTSAAEAVAHERNGYRAWALYTHVRQGELELERGAAATLARAMLHIDHDLFELRCVQRTAAVLEHARGAGNVSAELLEACAAACAIAGEPEGCAALVDEAAALCGGVAPPALHAALIEAHGEAGALDDAFAHYRRLEAAPGGSPPPGVLQIALMKACAGAHAPAAAFELLAELRAAPGWRRRVSGPGLLAPLVHACARAGDAARARDALALAKEIDAKIHSAAIWACATAAAEHPPFVELALQSWRDARAANVAVGRGALVLLLRACLAHGADAAAEEVLAQQGADGGLDLLHSLAWRDETEARRRSDPRQHGGREEKVEETAPRAVDGRGR